MKIPPPVMLEDTITQITITDTHPQPSKIYNSKTRYKKKTKDIALWYWYAKRLDLCTFIKAMEDASICLTLEVSHREINGYPKKHLLTKDRNNLPCIISLFLFYSCGYFHFAIP